MSKPTKPASNQSPKTEQPKSATPSPVQGPGGAEAVASAPAKPYLPWPTHVSEVPENPRRFRVERLSPFEWQAFVSDDKGERPIGKPDLFDILRNKVSEVMRAEGQLRYLNARKAAAGS